MKQKKVAAAALAALLLLPALPGAAAAGGTAYARTQTIQVNGKPVELNSYALLDKNGNETNYVRLRDVASLLDGTTAQFNVGWDGVVNLTTGQAYTPDGSEFTLPFSGDRAYTVPQSATKVDGTATDLAAILLTDDAGGGYTYYQLRALGAAVGCTVNWSAETGITLDTPAPEPVEPIEVADGDFDLEAFEQLYFTPPTRKNIFDAFTGEVIEGTLDNRAYELLADCNDSQIVMHSYVVDGVPIYECYRDDGTVKPVVLMLHGGGSDKRANLDNLIPFAQKGLYVVSLDAAGHGDSDRGPLVAPVAFAETVKSMDTLLEYYNTVEQADPSNAAIVGGSMGGNIAYCYVAFGQYPLTAIFPCLATPDLTLLGDGPLYDCFDHGKSGQDLPWTREQVLSFAEQYNPILYPERFLDTYIYAGNGALDDGASPEGPQALEQALIEFGGSNFEFYVDPDRSHERLPVYYDNLFTRVPEILLGAAEA